MPSVNFPYENIFHDNSSEESVIPEGSVERWLTELVVWIFSITVVSCGLGMLLCCCLYVEGQKTRDAQQPRRMYGERGPRGSSPSPPPTVFVTPHNIAPPPKYEMMAPPSYEEVVGVHYPNYSPPSATSDGNQVATSGQPIVQPLTVSVAHLATDCQNVTEPNQNPAPTTSGNAEQARSTTVVVASS